VTKPKILIANFQREIRNVSVEWDQSPEKNIIIYEQALRKLLKAANDTILKSSEDDRQAVREEVKFRLKVKLALMTKGLPEAKRIQFETCPALRDIQQLLNGTPQGRGMDN
jgi:hypothetical protein